MQTYNVSEAGKQAIVNALYTAARTYEECATTTHSEAERLGHDPKTGLFVLAGAFNKQAAEARRAAERLEEADLYMGGCLPADVL